MSQFGGWNPFQNEPLKLPSDYEWLKALTRAAGGDAERQRMDEADRAPFNRMVDAWLLAIALGTCAQQDDGFYEGPSHRFEYGSRLHGDADAIQFLHHVALAHLLRLEAYIERPEEAAYQIVENPTRVIEICNEYAARGLPLLREMAESGSLAPLAALLRGVMDLVDVAESPPDV